MTDGPTPFYQAPTTERTGMTDRWKLTRKPIYAAIESERQRQTAMWSHAHDWGWGDCSAPTVDITVKVAILAEEMGEVARAVIDKDDANLREELVQVAAVAVAILEGMDA